MLGLMSLSFLILAMTLPGPLHGAAWAATAEEEALYLKRLEANTRSTGLETYDPLEAVPGAQGASALPQASDANRAITPDALAKARAYAEANRSKAFLVWRDGALQTADYFGGTDAQSLIVARSLAKPLTSIAIGRAIKLGVIKSLDQNVVDFIPEWRGTGKATMKIRHLLDMRSGLLAQGVSPDPANIWNRAYLHPRHDDVLIHDYPLSHPPGSRYDYSNATSELVALVIERASKRRYAAFLSDEVFKPIGAVGGKIWIDRPEGLAHSGCCILLPAETWMRLALLLLHDGKAQGLQLLPKGYVHEMRQGTRENPHYGLGVYVAGNYVQRRGFANPALTFPKVLHGEPYRAADLFLFDGNANQVVYIVPSLDLVVLRVGDPPPREPEWDNAVLPNSIISGVKLKPGEVMPPAQPRE
jgi:CubicO group peptidase (beta-lactamase class C family)